jgi:Reverse transcriptase (RNA-dependent DNA polymerase)
VVCFESVRLILALSTLEDYYCVGVDVCNAYLYGKLDEEIYMRQPEGFKARGQENKVICLQCALYGLKQAGLAWWKKLNSSMNELGFKGLVSARTIKRLLLPLSMLTMLCSLVRTKLKSTLRRNSSWTNGNAET